MMASGQIGAKGNQNANGVYKFDSGVIWLALIAANIGSLGCVSLGIAAAGEGSKSAILCLLASLLLLAFMVHVGRLSGRSLQVSDDGIAVRDKRGSQIGSLHWVELGKVTERRKMA